MTATIRAVLAAAPAAPVVDDASIIREAADLLTAVSDSGVQLPESWRWPLIDELRGIAAALSEVTVDETTPRCGGEQYELDAYIWKRESTQEWVLELSCTIGYAHFISRHCEPLTTPPEDVAGLPSMYAAIQGESHD